MAQINLKNTSQLLTPPSGSIALGVSNDNIIVKDEQGNVKTIIGGEPLPSGGIPGQILSKKTSTNYDAEWVDITLTGTSSNDYLYLSDYSLNLESGSTSSTIVVYSTKNWTVENGSFVNASPSSGSSGNTTVTLTYNSNSLTDSRTDKITVTSSELGITQNLNINQKSGIKSEYYLSLSDNSITKSYNEVSAIFNIISTNNWTLTNDGFSNPDISSGTSGETTITLTFDQNTISTRYDRISVTDGVTTQSLKLTQTSSPSVIEKDYLNIDPNSNTITSLSGVTTFLIDTNISWEIPDTINDITITPLSGTSGTQQPITVTYPENTSPISQKRLIRINPVSSSISYKNYTLTQLPPTENYYIVSQSAVMALSGQTSVDVKISSNVEWEISNNINDSWITNITPNSGITDADVIITMDVNNNANTRQASITISCTNRTDVTPVIVTINQYGTEGSQSTKAPTITPKTATVSNNSGTTTFDVGSVRSWIIDENYDWLTTSPTGSTGNDTVSVNYLENKSGERSAVISVTDMDENTATFFITQGLTNSIIVKPDFIEVGSLQNSTSVYISSTGEWESEIDSTFGDSNGMITSVTPTSGDTLTTVNINYTENTTEDFRYGVIDFKLKSDPNINMKIKIKQGPEGGDTFGNIGRTRIKEEIDIQSGTTLSESKQYTDGVLSTSGFATESYVNTRSGTTLSESKQYTDGILSTSGFATESYVNTRSGTTLSESKSYTDIELGKLDFATESYVTGYTQSELEKLEFATISQVNTISGTTLSESKSYTDGALSTSGFATESYVNTRSGTTLSESKSYTDTEIGKLDFTDLATISQVNTISGTTLSESKSYTDTSFNTATGYTDTIDDKINNILTFGTSAPIADDARVTYSKIYIRTDTGQVYISNPDTEGWIEGTSSTKS